MGDGAYRQRGAVAEVDPLSPFPGRAAAVTAPLKKPRRPSPERSDECEGMSGGGAGGSRMVFRGAYRGSDPFTPPCKGAAGAPAARRKVGWSSEGTSEGGAG
ncbi:hypothetical protein GCM10009540_10580 [Streptomyces turgidiscabies]